MNIWLPSPIYRIKPIVYMIAAVVLFLSTANKLAVIIALSIIVYSVWICFMRLLWKDTGIVH